MFDNLKKKLRGVLPLSVLEQDAKTFFYACLNNETYLEQYSCLRAAQGDPDGWFTTWYIAFQKKLKVIAAADDRLSQLLAFRKEIVAVTKEVTTALQCFEYSDEDRAVLGKILMPDLNESDFDKCQYSIYSYAEIDCLVLRSMTEGYFGDGGERGWFHFFSDNFKHFSDIRYRTIIANAKDEFDVGGPFGPAFKAQLDKIEEQICEGMNWDYDREKVKAEQEEEDKKAELARESKKRPKQKSVSNSQIEDLSEYLVERIERLSRGEIYAAPWDEEGNKIHPESPANAFWIDLGMMLIAMTECVEDTHTAETAVRKAAVKAARRYANDVDVDTIDMSMPEMILSLWQQYEDEGPLARLLPAFVHLIYGDLLGVEAFRELEESFGDDTAKLVHDFVVNLEQHSTEITVELGKTIMDDCFEVNHYTKHVFGWDVGEYSRFWSSPDDAKGTS